MDQEQVDVVEAELGQRPVEGPAGIVGPVVTVVELAGDEHVGSVKAGGADRLAHAPLVAVHLGGVDVAVADLQRAARPPARCPAGGIWKTPKPSWGISCPSLSVIVGTVETVLIRVLVAPSVELGRVAVVYPSLAAAAHNFK